jgi:hypothetical protein
MSDRATWSTICWTSRLESDKFMMVSQTVDLTELTHNVLARRVPLWATHYLSRRTR